jgi:hypothetical protein
MSSSRSNDTSAEGVGREDVSVKRMFPPALMKSRRIFGVRFGPRPASSQNNAQEESGGMWRHALPFDFGGRMRRWS